MTATIDGVVVIDLDLDREAGGSAPGETAPEVLPSQTPKRIREFATDDWREVAIAAAAAASTAGLVFIVMNWQSWLGGFLWFVILFMLYYRLLAGELHGAVVAGDRLMTMLIAFGAALTVGALLWMTGFVLLKGAGHLSFEFFTTDMQSVGPRDKGGGASHALIGTLQQVGIATMVAVPIAIMTAVYLHEIKGRVAPFLRFFIDALSGLPSIVAGLLVYTIWIVQFGRGFSGIAGSMALIILMLPTVTRTAEEILRTVPDTLREASLALGAPHWRVILFTVLPTARSGLITAAILGVARAIGETAPLLLTASYASGVNANPFAERQASLPMFVWQLIRQPNQNQVDRAWAGAVFLLLTVFILFVLARYVGARAQRKLKG